MGMLSEKLYTHSDFENVRHFNKYKHSKNSKPDC